MLPFCWTIHIVTFAPAEMFLFWTSSNWMSFRKNDWVHVLPSKNSGICWIFGEQSYHDLSWKLTVKNLYVEILILSLKFWIILLSCNQASTIQINNLVFFAETSKIGSVDRLVFQTGAVFFKFRCFKLHNVTFITLFGLLS